MYLCGPKGHRVMNFNPCNRDEIRLRAVETTSAMLMRDGNLLVRMDDVAREMQVSKRTLYEIFGNKEELLVECMERHFRLITEQIEEEVRKEDDVLTVFLKHLRMLIEESRRAERVQFTDMDKYPRLKELFCEHIKDMSERMRRFMDLGVRQGVFRDDVNMDVLMMAFSAMGRAVNEESRKGTFPYDELIDGTMVVLLRGIATRDGMLQLEMFRYKFNNK